MQLNPTASFTASLTGSVVKAFDLHNTGSTFSISGTQSFANGTGDQQANQSWAETATLVASGTRNIDLNGAETDMYGDGVALTKVKGLIIKNTSNALATPTDAILEVGGAGNAWDTWLGDSSDKIQIKAGGILAVMAPDADGYSVTAGTGDELLLTNLDGVDQCSYEILVLGSQ